MISLQPASASDLVQHWRRIEQLLAEALPVAMGRYQPIDCLVMCSVNAATTQAWLVIDDQAVEPIAALAITIIVPYPRRKACMVFLLSGDHMADWIDLWTETVTAYARQHGCDHLEAQGRRGWARITGAHPAATIIVLEL